MESTILSFEVILFYILAVKLIGAALCVVLARNPVHSVLALIVAFLDTAVLFLLHHAEFLAFLFAIVYVGAVAILFLFVVIMFHASFESILARMRHFGLLASGLALFFITELGVIMMMWKSHGKAQDVPSQLIPQDITHTEALGNILYTDYFLAFQLAGMILLVAMVGAIVLTLKSKSNLKRQDPRSQVAREPRDTLIMTQPQLHHGAKDLFQGNTKTTKPPHGKGGEI